LLFFFV